MPRNRPTSAYAQEVAGLPLAYAAVKNMTQDAFDVHLEELRGKRAFMVASGGAAPAAHLAARVHREQLAQSAEAMGALAFVERRDTQTNDALVLFSSQAKHPDTAFAASHAIDRGMKVLLVTLRPRHELTGILCTEAVSTLTLASVGVKDGFLATQSVFAMATAVYRLYRYASLPDALPAFADRQLVSPSPRLLILHAQDGQPAAADIEIRFHELGLASVETTDFRNFAHGRHVGLSRRDEETQIIALTSEDSRQLAAKTLRTLPPGITTTTVDSPDTGDLAALDLLARVAALPSPFADDQHIEASKPAVPAFGRNLYHLPFKRLYPFKGAGPVVRKLDVAGLSRSNEAAHAFYRKQFTEWAEWASTEPLGALVLDYDGTCVTTLGRYALPTEALQEQLLNVIDAGIPLAFATGRGDSVVRDLRSWLPESTWSSITIGLHNGSWIGSLAENLDVMMAESLWPEELVDGLFPFVAAGLMTTRNSGGQVSVTGATTEMTTATIRRLVLASTERIANVNLTVACSGHSVDVFESSAGKADVVKAMSGHGTVMAIGDQGQIDGNDYDLLAATRLSISVDRCSADPTRCWNTSSPGVNGPQAVVETLKNLQRKRGMTFLRVKAREN